MRHVIALAILFVATTATAAPSEISVSPSATQDAVTEGETTLSAEPDIAYAVVADYAQWSVMFPDINQVIVTSRTAGDARVTLVHRDGNRDNLHFRNQPAARMVWFEDTGGRAEVWAELVFLPGDRPGTTRLHSRLYADVHGVASLLVSDRKLRNLREQRVRDDLTRLRAFFAREGSIAGR